MKSFYPLSSQWYIGVSEKNLHAVMKGLVPKVAADLQLSKFLDISVSVTVQKYINAARGHCFKSTLLLK